MDYDSSSDSDVEVEVLGDCSNHHRKPRHSRASHTTKNIRKTFTNRFSLRLKQNQHLTPSASISIHVETRHEHTPSDSSENESDESTIIQPTPCSKTTRSIFTKRRHRSPIATFDHSEDANGPMLSRSQAQSKISGLPSCRGKTAVTDTDTRLPHKSSLQMSSLLIKNRKQKWKRIASLISDSD